MPNKGQNDGFDGLDEAARFAPTSAAKQMLGKRVYDAMLARGWTQSELARHADVSRDKVSTYIRGKVMPTRENLAKLASALGVSVEQLAPHVRASSVDSAEPDLEMKRHAGMPANMMWLRVNRAVSMTAALQIAEILKNDDPNDTSRSGNVTALFPDKD